MLQSAYVQTAGRLRSAELKAKRELYTKLAETAAGSEHIRSFGWQAITISKSLALLDRSQKPVYYTFCLDRRLLSTLSFFTVVIAAATVGASLTWTKTASAPSLGLAFLGIIPFRFSSEILVVRWNNLQTSLRSAAHLKKLLMETPTERDGCHLKDPPYYWPRSGRIEIKNLSARYGRDEKSPLVLRDVNATVPHGKTAVVTGYPRR